MIYDCHGGGGECSLETPSFRLLGVILTISVGVLLTGKYTLTPFREWMVIYGMMDDKIVALDKRQFTVVDR